MAQRGEELREECRPDQHPHGQLVNEPHAGKETFNDPFCRRPVRQARNHHSWNSPYQKPTILYFSSQRFEWKCEGGERLNGLWAS